MWLGKGMCSTHAISEMPKQSTNISLIPGRRLKCANFRIHGVRKEKQPCYWCGNWYTRQQTCPAFGMECCKCGCKNHFAKVCHTPSRHLHGIHQDDETSSYEDMFIGAIQKSHNTKEWQITNSLNDQKTKFKFDIGAQCNVISKQKLPCSV